MKRLLLVLLLLPLAAAHPEHQGFLKPGEYLDHGKEAGANLDPGEWQNYTLAFGGGPMWEGWFYVVYGDSLGETTWTLINHNSTNHGETVHQWTWNGVANREINQFPDEGVYELQVQNTGVSTASIRFGYDQTCDCTFKPMPFSGSYAWFNPYLEAGETLAFTPGAVVVNQTDPQQTETPTKFTATHATHSGFGRTWDTFNIHGIQDATNTINITARETGVQYVLLYMETPDDARGLLLYSFEKIGEGDKETPFVGVGFLLLGLFMARRR